MTELSEKEKKIARFFVEREGTGILEEIRDIDFLEVGIMDSLDIVRLAVFIEQEFGQKIDLTNPQTMLALRRFDSLVALIRD